jgi:hypothetical protein
MSIHQTLMRSLVLGVVLLVSRPLHAQQANLGIHPECEGTRRPRDYSENVQVAWLQNFLALVMSSSPLHGPVPHDVGRGSLGVVLAQVPHVGCEQRFVMNHSKTEDVNRSPVLPQLSASASLGRNKANGQPRLLQPYVSVQALPPVPFAIAGTWSMSLSGAAGVGVAPWGERKPTLGLRAHGSLTRTIGDVALKTEEEAEDYLDLFVGSTVGVDLLFGVPVHMSPGVFTGEVFGAVGLLDVDSIFVVGDDNVITDNPHPYLGPALSLGFTALHQDRLRWAAAVFAAPGGSQSALGDESPESLGMGATGRLYGLRLRLAWETGPGHRRPAS